MELDWKMTSQRLNSTRNRKARFYLGTYTNPAQTGPLHSLGIYTGEMDLKTGRLEVIGTAGNLENPSFLALSPNGKNLYAASERPNGAVAAFRVEADGTLTYLNDLPTDSAGTCHVSVDATGRLVLAANYRGATFVAFQTTSDGALEKMVASVPLKGSGPNPQRQTQSFAHSIYPDPDNQFFYGCDLGSDNISCLQWNNKTLSLSTLPSMKIKPGAGPRHLIFSAEGNFLYVCNELDCTVTAFVCNKEKGTLAEIQNKPLLPEGTNTTGFLAAEIAIHPSGRWLYASTRDSTNAGRDVITIFSIALSGQLSCVDYMAAQVKQPRSFAIDSTGQWMIVAGQTSHSIVVLKINQTTGTLQTTSQNIEIPAPVCVLFGPTRH